MGEGGLVGSATAATAERQRADVEEVSRGVELGVRLLRSRLRVPLRIIRYRVVRGEIGRVQGVLLRIFSVLGGG